MRSFHYFLASCGIAEDGGADGAGDRCASALFFAAALRRTGDSFSITVCSLSLRVIETVCPPANFTSAASLIVFVSPGSKATHHDFDQIGRGIVNARDMGEGILAAKTATQTVAQAVFSVALTAVNSITGDWPALYEGFSVFRENVQPCERNVGRGMLGTMFFCSSETPTLQGPKNISVNVIVAAATEATSNAL
jgi:hypothetical protein